MSFVVSSDGGVPVGAETVGTSPAFAETVGSDPPVDDVESLEFINTPRAARPIKARIRIDATIWRGFFMGVTLSFTFLPSPLDSRSQPGAPSRAIKLGGNLNGTT